MKSLKDLSTRIRQILTLENADKFGQSISRPFAQATRATLRPIEQVGGAMLRGMNPQNLINQGRYLANAPQNIQGISRPVLETGRVVGNFGRNLGQVEQSAYNNILRGSIQANQSAMSGNPMGYIGGLVKTGFGMGKGIAPVTGLGMGTNLISSLPQIEKNDYFRRLSAGVLQGMTNTPVAENVPSKNVNLLGMEFDPVKAGGSLLGFTQNPAWKTIFPATTALFDPMKYKGAAFVVRSLGKGSIEGLIQGFSDMPENISTSQQAEYMAKNILFGAASEVAFNSADKATRAVFNKLKDSFGSDIGEFKRRWGETPITYWRGNKRVTAPYWRYKWDDFIEKTDLGGLRKGSVDLSYKFGADTQPKGVGEGIKMDDILNQARKDKIADPFVEDTLENSSHGVAIGYQNKFDKAFDMKAIKDSKGAWYEDAVLTPEKIYNTFNKTRDLLKKKYGNTITLYRFQGEEELIPNKHTLNWSTKDGIELFRPQFEKGRELISKEFPVDDIIALNTAGKSNKYQEFVVLNRNSLGYIDPRTFSPSRVGGEGIGKKVVPDLVMDESTKAFNKEILEAQKMMKVKPPKPEIPIVTKAEGEEQLTRAVLGEEDTKGFKNIFDKWIGQRDVARTTGAEYGIDFRKISPRKAQEFIKHAEGVELSKDPEIIAGAERWKQTTDFLYKDLQALAKQEGVDMGYIDNYVTHFWKESPQRVQQIMSAKGRSFGSRTIPTYAEGIELGLTPRYSNPAEIMSEYVAKIEKTKANIGLFKEMKNRGMIVPANLGRNTPGFSPINAPGFPRSVISHEGKVFDGSFYAPTSIAREVNRIFSPENTGRVGRAFNVAAKISKGTQDIVLSGGIPATPINAFTLAQMTKEFTSGSFIRPLKALGTSLFPDYTLEYFKQNANQIKKMQSRNVIVRSSFDTQGLTGGGNLWDKLISDATFKRFMPTLQIEFFNNIEKRLLEAGKGSEEAADIAAKAVQNFYGLTNTGDLAMRSQLGKDITSTFAFAPTYRESMINFWVKSLKSLTRPLALENRQNIKFLAGAAAIYGMMNHLNQLLNGHPMSENPTGKEDKLLIPVGETTIGVPFLSSIATVPRGIYRIVKDALGLNLKAAGADTLRTFGSMLIKPAGEMVMNEDYFGQQIYDPDGTPLERGKQIASYLFKSNQHPYIKAALEAKGVPLYQTLSKGAELPFRFYKTSSIQNAPFWDKYFATKKLDEKFQEMKYKDPNGAVKFYEENKSQLDSLSYLKDKIKAYYETGEDGKILQDFGVVQGDGHMAFTGVDGKFHLIDTNFDVPEPKYTGDELLDKKIKSSYISKLTAMEQNVLTLFENSIITAEQAEGVLGGIKDLKDATKAPKKPKKITTKVSKISYRAPKISTPKGSPFKTKSAPKFKAYSPKTISIKIDGKSLPAIKMKPSVNTLDKAVRLV